jgi:pimeloyl-ACP methyl ester carboxylesterase
VFARKTVGQIPDHLHEVLRGLKRKPALIGHSFGGLLVQILAGRGLASATLGDPAGASGPFSAPCALQVLQTVSVHYRAPRRENTWQRRPNQLEHCGNGSAADFGDFTIGMSADDLRVIAEHGYEGAASADQDQQHVGSREGKRKWREAAGFGHEPTQRASVLSHSPMMRACRSRSFGQVRGKQ